MYFQKMAELINYHLEVNSFPDTLTLADVYPVFKKGDRTNIGDYRPVSVLAYASKIFERIMHEQISQNINIHLSGNLCGYRKGFSSEHALISMYRWQRVKINHSFSSWSELRLGVPQVSVLGPLLFNIYLNNLLWFTDTGEVCNYADDTTLYDCNKDFNKLTGNLEQDSLAAIDWFEINYMKLNTGKCKLLVAGHKDHPVQVKVGNLTIEKSDKVKLLGVLIDTKLNFKEYLEAKIKKANSKLAVIKRNRHFL